jgi:putative phage-type endonuclease
MGFYLVEDIEQGTAKWLQWRRGVIGGSEAAIIMGENRWKGRQQLIDEKRGLLEPFPGNPATREGQALEGDARASLQKKFKEKLRPTIVQDSSEPFIAASLDAINKTNNQIYEIKCGYRTYEMVSSNRKVPSYYVAQVQHMLMVTQMESLQFAAYRPKEPLITFEVFRNEEYIRELRRKEKDFIRELASHGHKIQTKFRGKPVGHVSHSEVHPKSKAAQSKKDATWMVEGGLLKFWDGSHFIVGKKPGLYEVDGQNHYWDGEQWSIPKNPGYFILNGEESYWNGKYWE